MMDVIIALPTPHGQIEKNNTPTPTPRNNDIHHRLKIPHGSFYLQTLLSLTNNLSEVCRIVQTFNNGILSLLVKDVK